MNSPAAGPGSTSGTAAVADAAFAVPPPGTGSAAAEAMLREADWSVFDADRDLPPLRAALSELETREGVTAAHRLAVARLRERGALLRHPDGHHRETSCHALSPDGRHFAVGADIGDDYYRGGTLQVWEVATGRCVNMLDGIEGGVGWPSRFADVQWSADGRKLLASYGGPRVGVWDPFGEEGFPPPVSIDDATRLGTRESVGFAVHPDGNQIFLHFSPEEEYADSAVLGSLVELRAEAEPRRLLAPEPRLSAALDGAAMRPHVSYFSRDGKRLWGFGEWYWEADNVQRQSGLFCVDVAERRLSWFVDVSFQGMDDFGRMTVSPDETLVALNHGETLVLLDATTGEQLTETPTPDADSDRHDSPRLVWGHGPRGPRLAVLGERVRILDGGAPRFDIPIAPRGEDGHFPDGFAWAWSPRADRAALLGADGRIRILDLVDAPHVAAVLDAPEDACGLWWAAGDVLIVGGPGSLRFTDLNSARILGDFRFCHEVPRRRPLWDSQESDEEDLGEYFEPNPTFALTEDTWAVAFEEGVVIGPDDVALLDTQLAWSVDRRHAVPFRWGPAPVAASLAECFASLSEDTQDELRSLLDAAEPAAPAEWPPPDTADIDELYDVVIAAVLEYDGGWTPHVADAVRHAAKQRAREGRAEAAESLIALIPAQAKADAVRARGEVGLILAAAGQADFARRLLGEAIENATELHEHDVPAIASAIGAGLLLLGHDNGRDWIERAIAAINPEPNPWQHRTAVCWALLEGGLEDQARALWTEGEPGQLFSRRSWLAHLIRIGRDDLVREFALAPERIWEDNFDAWGVFGDTGRPDLMREWFVVDGRDIGDSEQETLDAAERNAAVDRPTAADLDELRDRYERLHRLPASQRRGETKELLWRAAACHHYGAVLDLLRRLPSDDDFNNRAATAERALWIALTGVDGDPW